MNIHEAVNTAPQAMQKFTSYMLSSTWYQYKSLPVLWGIQFIRARSSARIIGIVGDVKNTGTRRATTPPARICITFLLK
ncbi:MAG TPA: hypothetical protein VNL13_01555 [Sulfolobales archaeon]|nr:hypothetical protein [Sulfolobales archaeon]